MHLNKLLNQIALFALLAGIFAIGGSVNAQNAPSYILSSEDVVTVNVVNHPEFSGDFFIPSDGMLNLPGTGKVVAGGKSIDELTAQVKEGLSKRFLKPDVTVSLKTPRIQRIYVVGAVTKAGAYDVKPGWRITEALSAAGGLIPSVDKEDCKVIILRASSNTKEIFNLSDALKGIPEANALVYPGDVITIDSGDTIPVYVTGKVKSPGLLRIFKDNANIMNAIAIAGGLLPEASTDNVKITSLNGTSQVVNITSAVMDGKTIPDAKLQSGDMISIPESTSRIIVLGFVSQPGAFPVKDGANITLADALGMSRGFDNRRGGLEKVAIVRNIDGKQERNTYNIKQFLKTGDITQNPRVYPGDVIFVPETGRLDWDMVIRSVSALRYLIDPFVN
ncbi:MAG: SLBB domain-containing protein [Armatimonadota bacterium]